MCWWKREEEGGGDVGFGFVDGVGKMMRIWRGMEMGNVDR